MPLATPRSHTLTTGTPTSFSEGRDDRGIEEQTESSASKHDATQWKDVLESTMIDGHDMLTTAPPPILLERTRHSLSLLPNPAGKAGKHSSDKRLSTKPTRMSPAFPINQFETPHKMQTPASSPLETSLLRSGSSTPRDVRCGGI